MVLIYQPTGRESLVEKWILHKLNAAAAEVNRQLADRNFMLATSAAYNFWLYELCDVYIVRESNTGMSHADWCVSQEAMKPMTDESAPEVTKKSAQHTLYTCLDFGLRLLHPFMPFVTEELWQRLPRRDIDPLSLMLTTYPTFVSLLVSDITPGVTQIPAERWDGL
jgi:valyl-tRNA synthetase